ncbi:hypothetical protein N7457_002715 [Penicillium paradoxum]|uniref:uncharacterized protein n=1 Tax=Penicillium paradoxum TaxID=176176 RepID=UPI0025487442|nr:uncharacterized protein N7457_002715 [Penicillium paradoxum]KAJ5787725.1 hypothetical protein N7457_002715 [Penicillium paradoxum]
MDVEDIFFVIFSPADNATDSGWVTTPGSESFDPATGYRTSSHYGANRRVASPRFAELRTPVIPPGYQQIPGYETHRQRQEARARMGSIAERRGRLTPAPVLLLDVPCLFLRL